MNLLRNPAPVGIVLGLLVCLGFLSIVSPFLGCLYFLVSQLKTVAILVVLWPVWGFELAVFAVGVLVVFWLGRRRPGERYFCVLVLSVSALDARRYVSEFPGSILRTGLLLAVRSRVRLCVIWDVQPVWVRLAFAVLALVLV